MFSSLRIRIHATKNVRIRLQVTFVWGTCEEDEDVGDVEEEGGGELPQDRVKRRRSGALRIQEFRVAPDIRSTNLSG